MHTRTRTRFTPALLLTLALTTTTTHADTFTWSGTTGNFSDPTSWNSSAPTPRGSSSDQLVFSASSTADPITATIDSTGPWTLNSLLFDSAANNNITINAISNASLSFSGTSSTIVNNAATNITINALISSASDLSILGNNEYNSLTIAGPLSATGGNASLVVTNTITLNYQNNAAPAGFAQTVLGDASSSSYGAITWNISAPDSAPAIFSFGSGPIIMNNGFFNVNVGSLPSVISFTNPIVVTGNGGVKVTVPAAASLPTINFTGPVTLGGTFSFDSTIVADDPLSHGPTVILSGNITLDQSTSNALYLACPGEDIEATIISGNIIDDPDPSHLAHKPLAIEGSVFRGSLTISGTANTYSTGTEIIGGAVTVAPKSHLGTGYIAVRFGTLILTSPDNLALNQKVLVSYPLATLAVTFDQSPYALLDPNSVGILALDTNFSTLLNEAAIGNGLMALGSDNQSAYTASTLAPDIDGVYRFATPLVSNDNNSHSLTLLHSVLVDYNNKPTSAQLSGVTLAAPNSFSGGSLVFGKVVASASGALGAGNVTIGGSTAQYLAGTDTFELDLSAPSVYAATAIANVYGTLAAVGPNGSIPLTTTAPLFHSGSTLILGDNLNHNSDRYPDAMPLALHNSTLQLNATGITTESIGPLSFSGASALIFQNPSTGNHSTTLVTPSLTHSPNSVLFISLTNASLDPTASSSANLLVTNAPQLTNGIVSPAIQLRVAATSLTTVQSTFLTYTLAGFSPATYVSLPTTGGTGTEVVDVPVFNPPPAILTPALPSQDLGSLSTAELDTLQQKILELQASIGSNAPSLAIPSASPESLAPSLQIPINPVPPLFISNPNSFANTIYASPTQATIPQDTTIYALRTEVDLDNPASGPITLHILSGGLIVDPEQSILIQPNLDFGSAEAIINIDGSPYSTNLSITGKVIARNGFTKVGAGQLALLNPDNQIDGTIAIYEGNLLLTTDPSIPIPNPIIISANSSLYFSSSVTLAGPIHIYAGGLSPQQVDAYLQLPAGATLTLAAPLTIATASSFRATSIIINAPIQTSNYLEVTTGNLHLGADISGVNLSITGNITGADKISATKDIDFEDSQISPGNTPGDLDTFLFDTPDVQFVDSSLEVDLDADGHSDHLFATGKLELIDYSDPSNPELVLNLNFLAPPTGQTYTLLTAASLSGTFSAVTGLPANYTLDYTPTSLLLLPTSQTPEPTSLALLTLTLPTLLSRKTRPSK